MKVLSIRQPVAYLAGCLRGDAWISSGASRTPSGYFCLRVADMDFAESFAAAIAAGFGVAASVCKDERGYALVRKSNGKRRFDMLKEFEPTSDEQTAAWLRGLFDSEGNVVCVPKPKAGPRSWDRRVAIFSTDHTTLDRAQRMLTDLDIQARKLLWSCGDGHKGNKPVYAMNLVSGKENFSEFARIVGSSIARKQASLDLLASTYHPDRAIYAAEAQAKGAEVRRARRDAGGIY